MALGMISEDFVAALSCYNGNEAAINQGSPQRVGQRLESEKSNTA